LVGLLLVSCGREASRDVEAIAVLPFENLAAAPELDWMVRGFPEAVRLQLAGTARSRPLAVSSLRDVPSTGATRTLHGYFTAAGGRLSLNADLEDVASLRMVKAASASAALSEGMLPLAREVARAIDPNARELPTKNTGAFRAYVAALEAAEPMAADREFEHAIGADPGFGAAYLAWAQALISRGDRTHAAEVLAAARGNAARFPALERDRLGVMSAALAGDRAAERQALIALTRSGPADAGVYRSLGELDTASHAYASAAKWYDQALALQPDDVALLNQLGYVRVWAGDLDGAVQALSRYRERRPNEANPLDSLGDAYYYVGRFAEAGKGYQAAYAKDPSFLAGGELYKAAWARLMQADLRGADEIFGQFLRARQAAGDVVPYRQAQWEYLTGHRRQAMARLEQFAKSTPPPVSALAFSQLAIWSLEAGDRARARQFAEAVPAASPLGAFVSFLTQPPAPAAEWAARAARLFPQPAQAGLRSLTVAYALLLSKDFRGAAGPLEQIYAATTPSSPDWPAVPLAWALSEAGSFDRVPQLLNANPVPEPTGEHPLLSLSFPRIFYLRGALAERQNRREDAKRAYRTFLLFAGDLPDFFGERDRAARALAGP
jgi:tetratricopeptide (TPR) repeat protein